MPLLLIVLALSCCPPSLLPLRLLYLLSSTFQAGDMTTETICAKLAYLLAIPGIRREQVRGLPLRQAAHFPCLTLWPVMPCPSW